MLKPAIQASEATAPFNEFDSKLEIPSGRDCEQNAWLTIDLKVKLNFVDSKNPNKKMVNVDGKWYASDYDKWLFPALDWSPAFKDRFSKGFQAHAEKVWNWQFVLVTPMNYTDLDYMSFQGKGWRVRPNVLCLFRCNMVTTGANKTINVYNLDLRTTSVKKKTGETQSINSWNSRTWRSDDVDYDDRDLFAPVVIDEQNKIVGDTVGHEIGHALGQAHILGLKGNPKCALSGEDSPKRYCYGHGSADKFDAWNIMGGGNRVYLINAVSWQERMALHTGRKDWTATGVMNTPTRKIPMGVDVVAPVLTF